MKRIASVLAAVAVALLIAWRMWPEASVPPREPVERTEAAIGEVAPQPRRLEGVQAARPASVAHVTDGAGLIAGRVIDDDDLGVADARVVFKSMDDLQIVRTDADGFFEVRSLAAGKWTLEAVLADGFEGDTPALDFNVSSALDVEGLEFRMAKALPVVVVDAAFHPIGGATLEALGNRLGLRATLGPLPAVSDAKGRLDFTLLPGDDLVVHHPAFEDTRVNQAVVEHFAAERERVVQLQRKGSLTDIAVRVIDQRDVPVETVTFEFRRDSTPDAAFDFVPNQPAASLYLGDGGYLVRFPLPADRALKAVAFHRSYLVKGDRSREQILHVQRPTAAIWGHVVSGSGAPVQAFGVTVMDPRGNAVHQSFFSSEGLFRVPVAPGDWMLSVSAPGHPESYRDVTVPSEEDVRLDVELESGRTVTGVVIDRQTKAPIGGALIRAAVSDVEVRGFADQSTAYTQDDGAFALRAVPPGRFEVEVQAVRYAARSFPVEANATHIQVELGSTPAKFTTVREWEGVGGTLEECPNHRGYCFSSFVSGAGAKSAGLLEGDEVLAVDGQPVGNDELDDLILRIRGPAGTLVHLSIRRGDATLEFNVVRRLLRQE
jgi:hypothetical protein